MTDLIIHHGSEIGASHHMRESRNFIGRRRGGGPIYNYVCLKGGGGGRLIETV